MLHRKIDDKNSKVTQSKLGVKRSKYLAIVQRFIPIEILRLFVLSYSRFTVILLYFCCSETIEQQKQQKYGKFKRANKAAEAQNQVGEHLTLPRHLPERGADIRVSEIVPDT